MGPAHAVAHPLPLQLRRRAEARDQARLGQLLAELARRERSTAFELARAADALTPGAASGALRAVAGHARRVVAQLPWLASAYALRFARLRLWATAVAAWFACRLRTPDGHARCVAEALAAGSERDPQLVAIIRRSADRAGALLIVQFCDAWSAERAAWLFIARQGVRPWTSRP